MQNNFRKMLFCIAGALLLSGCSKQDATTGVTVDLNYPIRPTSQLDDTEQSRTIVNAGSAFSASLFRVDAVSGVYPSDYTGVAALPAAVAAGGSLAITPEQYYQTDGSRTALLGVYPAIGSGGGAWNATSGTVTYAVDGKTDVMATVFVEGNKTSAQPSLVFSHFLTRIHVSVYAANQTTIDLWGRVESIAVVGREPVCTLTLPGPGQVATAAGAAFSGPATDLLLTNADGTAASALAVTATNKADAQSFGYGMFAPTTAALTLKVVTAKGATNTVTLPSGTFAKGKAYDIALKIAPSGFVSDDEVTIIAWEDGTSGGPIDADLI